jgi:hypothetical protein
MMHMKRFLTFVVAALVLSAGAHAQIQELFEGKRTPPTVHPKGYFALELPRGWNAEFDAKGDMLATGGSGDVAQLRISVQTLPTADADTELVALNHSRELRKLPNFRDGGGGRLKIGGKPASIRSFLFDYNGNTEYTVSVEELYIVSGRVMIMLHFEVMKRSFANYGKDLKQIYDSLGIADMGADALPLKPATARKVR